MVAAPDADRRRRMCTGKKRYRDEQAAMAALHGVVAWDEAAPDKELRAYRCDYCERWHLTSQPRR